ncbi:MAG: hypothetical protein MUE30_04780 [Spirosomaceae bacterium]|nr:hypothetical protein [Spirosomataceae bacterium]
MQIKLLFLASIITLFTSCQKDDVNGSDSTFFKATTKEANTSTKVYNITEGEFSVNFR